MARVHFDPVVRSFSGKLGGFVYYQNRSVPCVRRYVVPCNPNTPLQRKARTKFADAVLLWQTLESYKKEQWSRRAAGMPLSGYNLFLSSRLKKDSCFPDRASDSSFVLLPAIHSVCSPLCLQNRSERADLREDFPLERLRKE